MCLKTGLELIASKTQMAKFRINLEHRDYYLCAMCTEMRNVHFLQDLGKSSADHVSREITGGGQRNKPFLLKRLTWKHFYRLATFFPYFPNTYMCNILPSSSAITSAVGPERTTSRMKSFKVPPSMNSVIRLSRLSLYKTPMNFRTFG